MLDADEVTRLRTAATTALAATMLQPLPQTEIGLVGSGFEATGHLRAMARTWPLSRGASTRHRTSAAPGSLSG